MKNVCSLSRFKFLQFVVFLTIGLLFSVRTAYAQNRVRVLVLYTTNAHTAGDPIGDAPGHISTTNSAMFNSSINGLSFELAAVEKLEGFTEANSIQADLRKLKNQSGAPTLRATHTADIVILLTNGNYGAPTGTAFVEENGDPAFAYAIVQVNADSTTFPHEVAHLFGARHEVDDLVDNGTNIKAYAHGHSFRGQFDQRLYSTLMSKTVGAERIPYFSNPGISYASTATGVPNSNDNARRIREMASTVANYYENLPDNNPIPLNVSLNGKTYISQYEIYRGQRYSAYVSNGTAPYSYKWKQEYCCTFTDHNKGNSHSQYFSFYPNGDTVWKLELNVTDANGNNGYKALNVTVQQGGGGGFPYYSKAKIDIENPPSDQLQVLQNPIKNELSLGVPLDEIGTLEIRLFAVDGKMVKSIFEGQKSAGYHEFKEDTSEYATGLYYISTRINGKDTTKKLLIQN